MIIDFSRTICIEQGFCPEFRFDALYTTVNRAKYNVQVPDKAGMAIYFTMEKESEGYWKIINAPSVPQWVINVEPKLNETIKRTLAGIS